MRYILTLQKSGKTHFVKKVQNTKIKTKENMVEKS